MVNSVLKSLLAAHTQNAAVKLRIWQTNLPEVINHNTFLGSFFAGIRHFHISHNAPYLPPKFCITFVFISPGYYSRPKRN